MTLELHGTYQNKTIQLQEALDLPEGARVKISIEKEPFILSEDEALMKVLDNAPEDQEDFSEDDLQALEDAEKSIREQGTVSWEKVKRDMETK